MKKNNQNQCHHRFGMFTGMEIFHFPSPCLVNLMTYDYLVIMIVRKLNLYRFRNTEGNGESFGKFGHYKRNVIPLIPSKKNRFKQDHVSMSRGEPAHT
jgi:hypothetical protein